MGIVIAMFNFEVYLFGSLYSKMGLWKKKLRVLWTFTQQHLKNIQDIPVILLKDGKHTQQGVIHSFYEIIASFLFRNEIFAPFLLENHLCNSWLHELFVYRCIWGTLAFYWSSYG